MENKMIDIIIVGGGQAGLAMGYQLSRANRQYLIIDANPRTGDSWRGRYDSMMLFTSRAYCQLPGLNMRGDLSAYPSKDEMADYLEHYTKHHQLNIEHNAKVSQLSKTDEVFTVEVQGGQTYRAKAVVVASGAFQVPKVLTGSAAKNLTVPQYTVASYKNVDNMPQGTVLVIGDGASGRQIALDATPRRKVLLATGKKRHMLPQRVMGKDVFHWLDKLGILWAGSQSLIAQIMRKRDPFPGQHLALKKLQNQGVIIIGKVVEINKDQVTFADGQSQKVDALVWAMGYDNDCQWLDIPQAIDHHNHYHHDKGCSPVAGLFYMGLPWQTCRASALVAGLANDSALISAHLARYLSTVK